ncbi:MAG: sulfite exporter TauE/SafE family protein [Kofleriaceae bacterium]
MTLDAMHIALVAFAAFGGGLVNAIAGGGSLITFPTLVALGVPPVIANVTNTVALCPGYFGATIAQRADLEGQRARLVLLLPLGAIAGAGGALLLLHTGESTFVAVVPFLILFAALLVGAQGKLRGWLEKRDGSTRSETLAAIPVTIAAVYGGYFGAGVGVIILAALGVVLADTLTRLNALKQTISLTVNVSAAIVFVVRAPVDWTLAAVMAGAALAGGLAGGALASRIPANLLRVGIVLLGTTIACVYVVKG